MISALDSASGLPISSVITSARSSALAVIASNARRRISPRSRGGCAAHSSCTAQAASRAALASSGVASATLAIASPVDGSSTSKVPPPPSRHSPPMNSCVGTASTAVFSWVALILSPGLWVPGPRVSALVCRSPGSSCHHRLRSELLRDGHVERVVDRDHDQARELERQGVSQVPAEVLDRLAAPRRNAAGGRQLDEIRVREVRPEVATELLVLLPDDRAELGVLPDDVHDRG